MVIVMFITTFGKTNFDNISRDSFGKTNFDNISKQVS